MGISYITEQQLPATTKITGIGQRLLLSKSFNPSTSEGVWNPTTLEAPFTTTDYAITTVTLSCAGSGAYGYAIAIGIGATGSEISISSVAISCYGIFPVGQHVLPVPPIIEAGTALSFRCTSFGMTAFPSSASINFLAIPATEIG